MLDKEQDLLQVSAWLKDLEDRVGNDQLLSLSVARSRSTLALVETYGLDHLHLAGAFLQCPPGLVHEFEPLLLMLTVSASPQEAVQGPCLGGRILVQGTLLE